MAKAVTYSQPALDNLEQSQQDLENSLQGSPGTYSDSLDPSSTDINTEAKLRSVQTALDAMQAKQINDQWYGEQSAVQGNNPDSEGNGSSGNLLTEGLGALAKPLYAVVGAAKYLTGDRSGNFFDTVNQNINTDKSTFGDILSKAGTPKIISAPLGFALDVAFDPINWATMGTGAIIPKITYGLGEGTLKSGLEGGLEAAAQGVKEKAFQTAATVGKYIPILSESPLLKSIGEGAVEAGERYNALTGRNLMDIIASRASKPSVGDYASQALHALPGGDWVAKNFSYSPADWLRVAKIKDQIMTAAKEQGHTLSSFFNPETGLIEAPNFNIIKQTLSDLPVGEAGALTDSSISAAPLQKISDVVNQPTDVYSQLFNKEQSIMKDGIDLSDKFAHLARSSDSVETMTRMLGEAGIEAQHQDIVRALNELGGTGNDPNAFDKLMTSVRGMKIGNVEVGKNLLDTYAKFIGTFKSAHIGFLSPASISNEVAGQTAMLHMAGADITRPEYLQNTIKAWNFVTGRDSAEFLDSPILTGDEWQKYMADNPGVFQKTFGFSGNKVLQAKSLIDEAIARAPQLAGGDKMKAEEIKNIIYDTFKNKQSELAMGSPLKYSMGAKASERATDIASQELTTPAFLQWKNDLQDVSQGLPATSKIDALKATMSTDDPKFAAELEKLKPNDVQQKAAAAMHWALTVPSQTFSNVSQAARLGSALTWVQDGVTEKELLKMTNSVIPGTSGPMSILPTDIMEKYMKDGQYFYRLTPDKATELTNMVHVNYAAMPAAVKVLRSLPVIGAPFFSFQYAMATKLGQTLLSNPAAINKVAFAMHEVAGSKTPLEKEALKTPYYQYLNDPGMVKLPFFQENPLYLNVASLIPYYNMNMFEPSNRKYNSTLGSQLTSVLDKLPIMKDPVGQTIFDYFIQPMILKDSNEIAQGQYGQPLYPQNTGALGMAGYAARNLVDSFLPTTSAVLAPVTPPSLLQYAPGYRWRQLGEAIQGKTQLGAIGKESAVSRTLRALGSITGVSTEPLDLTFAATQYNKKKK